MQPQGCAGPGKSLLECLQLFVAQATRRGLIAELQAQALQDFAFEFAAGHSACDGLPDRPDSRQADPPGTSPDVAPPTQPQRSQLHIQPLDLTAGLLAAGQSGIAAACGAADAPVEPQADIATSAGEGAAAVDAAADVGALASHAHLPAAFMALGSGADAALLQQQPCSSEPAAVVGGPPSATTTLQQCASHELLQALAFAADVSASCSNADAAAEQPLAPAGSSKASSVSSLGPAGAAGAAAAAARKQRFSREQHAAILESVERNYAQCPSRYTELVIKEMQARFPGIELNNACVRKIKFRANEARQQCVQQQQLQCMASAVSDSQAVAGAAQCLLGLAAAAAAAAAAETAGQPAIADMVAAAAAAGPGSCPQPLCLQQQPCHQPCPQAPEDPAAAAAAFQLCGASAPGNTTQGICPQPTVVSAAAECLPGSCGGSVSPETPSVAADPVAATLLAGKVAVKMEQQPEQILATATQPGAAGTEAGALSLQVKLPQASGAAGAAAAACAEECVDSATAAAAEAMNLLASNSTGSHHHHQQQQQQCAGAPADARSAQAAAVQAAIAAAAAVSAAATAHADSSVDGAAPAVAGVVKRKREASVGPQSEAAAAAVAAAAAAAAGASGSRPGAAAAAAGSLGLQQAASAADADAAAASLVPAAYDSQQQQLQQMQAAWGMAYGAGMAPANLQQQALQVQLASGLYGGYGFPALLQQQQSLLLPGGSAAQGGQQPAAKRQRLSGAQMAELVASVKHHVQANPERYTHCVIKDMKEKYPDLELNMGQIRKIKFRTLGNANGTKQGSSSGTKVGDAAAGSDPCASSRQE